jgi:DNA-binding beta-propeller fold protein YncE
VTCTATTRIQGAVVLYDTRLGQIVKQVDDVGRQPYGIAVHRADANKARLFVTNFGDGRVAVIDIKDLANPQSAELIAYLGKRQGRDEKQGTSTCEQETEP